jgi:hypothetical protein
MLDEAWMNGCAFDERKKQNEERKTGGGGGFFLKDEDELKVGRCRVPDMGRVTLDVSSQIAAPG